MDIIGERKNNMPTTWDLHTAQWAAQIKKDLNNTGRKRRRKGCIMK